jgi:predicted nucleic acid-binding Zn ribbon protein
MPVYTYRREDGTTFDYRQKFTDDPLAFDPTSGQRVVRVVQNAGVIFKGSGFYVNDSKSASKKSLTSTSSKESSSTETSSADSTPKADTAATTAASSAAD